MVEEINEGNMRGGIFIIIIIKKGLKSMKMWQKKIIIIETTPWDKLSINLIDLTFNIVSLVSY